MKILTIFEPQQGELKKQAFELATYARKTAESLGGQAVGFLLNTQTNATALGHYGIQEVITADLPSNFDDMVYATAIQQVAQAENADLVILSHNANGRAVAGRIAMGMQAGLISGATSVPQKNDAGYVEAEKGVFSGKAKAKLAITTEKGVITLMNNSLRPEKVNDNAPEVRTAGLSLPEARVEVAGIDRVTGSVPLTEAELVVSAGRGMKGPENWGMVEELAEVLGAATACSRPVADVGWRPHHEHVGQTGIAIRPNLYIAIGISGAIQHLAGVNNSKVIVVINKDPEAPFFKAADYGVVGDAFEVLPRLTEALRNFKAAQ